MKHLLIAAALAAAPGWALAQASGEVPKHKCEPKPEMPGRVMMQDESVRKRFQADVDKYKNCISAYVEERRAVIKENEKAANGAIDEYNVSRLRCAIVCGSANNQLAYDGLGEDLAGQGILYAPDFIVNAGGLINVATELDPEGYDPARVRGRVLGIEETMRAIYDEADASGVPPLAGAYSLARRRLAAAGMELH